MSQLVPDDETLDELLGIFDQSSSSLRLGPGSSLGIYRILGEVARGGMGVVYRAHHTALDREVALKVLPEYAETDMVLRQEREAKLAARLIHPNIVAVHEAGSIDSIQFIAMDFVEGPTLSQALPELALPRRIEILEQVSRAVHHAHEQQILHRDLKPANILLDQSGRARVTDFGLARSLDDGSSLTRTGIVLGTPAYMAPEQLSGTPSNSDPRTDVYALGVLLYLLLTDQVPFTGESHEALFAQILNTPPPPPSQVREGVDPALEIICLKALAKQRSQRFQSALDFAEDLKRFQLGQPIHARRVRPPLRRRRLGWILAAAAGLALLALGASLRGHWPARDSAPPAKQPASAGTLAGARADLREALEEILRLRRAGQLEQMATLGQQTQRRAWGYLGHWPEQAQLHYLWGRILRALMKDAAARQAQQRALDRDPAHAGARYEQLLLLARQQQQRIDQLATEQYGLRMFDRPIQTLSIPGWCLRPGRRHLLGNKDAEALRLAEQIKGDLRLLEQRSGEHRERLACARAWQSLITGGTEQTRSALRQLIASERSRVEAYQALALLETSLARYRVARRVWNECLKADRGFLPALLARAQLDVYLSLLPQSEPKATRLALEASLRDCSWGLRRRPDHERLRMTRSAVCLALAQLAVTDDPTPMFERALADTLLLLKAHPGRSAAVLRVAELYLCRAEHHFTWRRRESLPQFKQATRYLTRAIQLDPALSLLQSRRGAAYSGLATEQIRHGLSPVAAFENALRDLEQALTSNTQSRAHRNARFYRAMTHSSRATWRIARGEDPVPDLERALEDLRTTLKFDESNPRIWLGLGRVQHHLGYFLLEQGAPRARRLLESATESYRRAQALDQRLIQAWLGMSQGALDLARALRLGGQDPTQRYQQASQSASRAIELAPNWWHPHHQRGVVRHTEARDLLPRGQAASELLTLALKDHEQAISLNRSSYLSWRGRGACHLIIAQQQEHLQDDDSALHHYRLAAKDMARASKRNATDARSWYGHGLALYKSGILLYKKQRDPLPQYEAAARSMERALTLNPRLGDAWLFLAVVRHNQALRSKNVAQARGYLQQAIGRYQQLLASPFRSLHEQARAHLKQARAWLSQLGPPK